ncbi:dehydrogenase/reductase SDR family member FEY-like isoform X2 [Cucurbita moschata]|uniref:Dehydrogenase/reductase SDR family member FEY-like isoform X2 n=1 Tax=Cucurbita moschata TaxID=3662 RepID=A0A6J1E8U5_CUCMO|nr:dehydrogenase/reductase SDR family member FEY-like isoform X2 [Cucurbita moschata]
MLMEGLTSSSDELKKKKKEEDMEHEKEEKKNSKKGALGWIEWLRGWMYVIHEMLFQRILASHLQNPMPLPPVNDLTCIVTGSTSGIGREIARQLAESGAHVVMAVRNPKAALDLIQKWQNEWSGMGLPLNIEVMELDLLSLDSVVKFAEAYNARMGPLHVLINNAGIFSIGEPQKFSKDGYEEHLQVNHLAPALLSILLLPSLIRGSPSRIINVNSVMHYVGFVDTEDMNIISSKRKFTSLVGYSSSKLAQVMFSSVLHKKLPVESGINVVCVSPGIVHTNVARDLSKFVQAAYGLIPYFIFSPQEGSRSTLFAATDPQVPEYCELLKADQWPVCAFLSQECRPTNPSEEAHNVETSYQVWEKTMEMVGLTSDVVERLLEGEQVGCRYGGTDLAD